MPTLYVPLRLCTLRPVLCALAAFRLVELDALPGWLQAMQTATESATHAASEGLVSGLSLGAESRGRVEALAGGVTGALHALHPHPAPAPCTRTLHRGCNPAPPGLGPV